MDTIEQGDERRTHQSITTKHNERSCANNAIDTAGSASFFEAAFPLFFSLPPFFLISYCFF